MTREVLSKTYEQGYLLEIDYRSELDEKDEVVICQAIARLANETLPFKNDFSLLNEKGVKVWQEQKELLSFDCFLKGAKFDLCVELSEGIFEASEEFYFDIEVKKNGFLCDYGDDILFIEASFFNKNNFF